MSNSQKSRAIRLTPAQVELLRDLAMNPQMYVRRFSRWGKTIRALIHRGLADMSSDDWHMPEYKITDAGLIEARRRGLIPDQKTTELEKPS